VVRNDVEFISQVKGLGKKTAERIVLELKDKVGVVEAWEQASEPTSEDGGFTDGLLALIHLGYNQTEARKALAQLRKQGELPSQASADEIIRAALRILN
jgi:Holliday junction DNA helicase RuvA